MQDAIISFFRWCFMLCACIPFTIHAANLENVRGSRYCEIIYTKLSLTLPVYSTFNLNNCPEAVWKTISTDEIKKETGASKVLLNGPRFFLMDKIVKSHLINSQIVTLGGIQVREAGILHLSFKDLVMGFRPYIEHEVKRDTIWVYDAGKPVYELINPAGQVFVMQSYSIQHEPQTEASLSNLGEKLKPPIGWTFRAGNLKVQGEVVAVKQQAVVIQDELRNTYQLATYDLLNA